MKGGEIVKRLEIIRVDPNTGYVVRLDNNFRKIKITEILPYRSCMAFVIENQQEAKIYKIGKIGTRKNARRKFDSRFLAADDEEAIRIFNRMEFTDNATYQLLTGDWKVLKEKKGN